MAVIQTNEKLTTLLARLMRAEAEGDGELSMLMVGNVEVRDVRADYLDLRDVRSIEEIVYQRPGGFETTLKGYFYQQARPQDIRLAERVIQGERFHPATRSLWFYRPSGDCLAQWYGQWNSGRFKSHCFFSPLESQCTI